ncbi:MAG: hypothetical protein KME12_08615 [Trichocoleus desertorum ATA4-8-CV12]|nr:hypothetical protein [Trichocoleus desertorum ATA4-8-CV12]
MASSADDRKKRIMEHLARSTGKFSQSTSPNSDQRRQQILDHVRRTKG